MASVRHSSLRLFCAAVRLSLWWTCWEGRDSGPLVRCPFIECQQLGKEIQWGERECVLCESPNKTICSQLGTSTQIPFSSPPGCELIKNMWPWTMWNINGFYPPPLMRGSRLASFFCGTPHPRLLVQSGQSWSEEVITDEAALFSTCGCRVSHCSQWCGDKAAHLSLFPYPLTQSKCAIINVIAR